MLLGHGSDERSESSSKQIIETSVRGTPGEVVGTHESHVTDTDICGLRSLGFITKHALVSL